MRFYFLRALSLLLLVMVSHSSVAEERFDHFSSSFPLFGAHAAVECAECHVRGIFKGTPRQCSHCHTPGSLVNASGKHAQHIPSSNQCEECHNNSAWWPAFQMDHGAIVGSCQNCHNGGSAEGKHLNHIVSSNACENCHNSRSWLPAVYDHSDAIGSCSSCHNGVQQSGKSADHLLTSFECDSCHTIRGWSPARFNHSGITATCSSCHNGTTATGKHPQHVVTTTECGVCHTTSAWLPAGFDHSNAAGNCSGCHDGTTATGKGNDHFITNQQCDSCHITSNWDSLIFTHSSALYPGRHRSPLSCNDSACHGANSELVTWPSPTYSGSCAGCHANDFDTGEHDENLSTLRDCSGSCHHEGEFEAQEHRVNDSSFD